jgi:hypothetical protein
MLCCCFSFQELRCGVWKLCRLLCPCRTSCDSVNAGKLGIVSFIIIQDPLRQFLCAILAYPNTLWIHERYVLAKTSEVSNTSYLQLPLIIGRDCICKVGIIVFITLSVRSEMHNIHDICDINSSLMRIKYKKECLNTANYLKSMKAKI